MRIRRLLEFPLSAAGASFLFYHAVRWINPFSPSGPEIVSASFDWYQSPIMDLDLLRTSAGDLQALLSSGQLQSTDLVAAYLDQIERHNHNGMKLHAIISSAPREEALEYARRLDAERSQTGPRGPMHGIPVIVKVISLLSPPVPRAAVNSS
jgi:hypothetical protein